MSHEHVQAELLLPHEIEARLALRSVVYLPLGSIEYHSHHLPVGLDGLTAHGVCLRAADVTGGVVLPVQYVGTGGTHTAYPWTLMAADATPIADLLGQTLRRLADLGVAQAVLFTGHFADEQLAMIDDLAATWNAAGAAPDVLALAVNRTDAALSPDHAGVFESTLLSALHPDRVDLSRLPALDDWALEPDPPSGDFGHRHDPGHPLWGVMGADPRGFDPADADAARRLLAEVVDAVVARVLMS